MVNIIEPLLNIQIVQMDKKVSLFWTSFPDYKPLLFSHVFKPVMWLIYLFIQQPVTRRPPRSMDWIGFAPHLKGILAFKWRGPAENAGD